MFLLAVWCLIWYLMESCYVAKAQPVIVEGRVKKIALEKGAETLYFFEPVLRMAFHRLFAQNVFKKSALVLMKLRKSSEPNCPHGAGILLASSPL